MTLQREKAHSSWGHIHLKDRGDGPSTKAISWLPLGGRIEEVDHLRIQDLIELFMFYL